MHLSKVYCNFGRFIISRWYGTMNTMRVWETFQYGDPEVLQCSSTANVPVLTNTKDILVKVHAASVNPIDVMMLKGYGASVIGVMRQMEQMTFVPQEFPLILGRDFSGTVVRVGPEVKDIKPGDEVWGAIGAQQNGSHADYVIPHYYCVTKKPQILSHVEASAIPYAALTAWSALCTFGGLSKETARGKRILVFGASGGVGSLAVQLLKAWDAEVTATCSIDAIEMVKNLRVDYVVDYVTQDVKNELSQIKGFDFIFDCVGGNKDLSLELLKKWSNSKYVSIVSPLLKNADQNGLIFGSIKSAAQATCDTLTGLRNGQSVRWAFFVPNGHALKTIKYMVESGEIKPVIDETFKFEDTPEAYRKVLNGHLRGKVVIDHTSEEQSGNLDQSKESSTTESN